MNITKVLGIGLIALTLGACAQQTAPKGDAYFFLFAAHTSSTEIPTERQTGLLAPPQVFQTEADCFKVLKEATASVDTPEAKKWLADHQIDRLKAVCVPVKF